jgi:hypothetical protein
MRTQSMVRPVVSCFLVGISGILAGAQSRQAAPPPEGPGVMSVWTKPTNTSYPNSLRTEFTVNDTLVDIFSSGSSKPIDKFLKEGWNTVATKTTPIDPITQRDPNGLVFQIGPTFKDPKRNQDLMVPILWEFNTRENWRIENGRAVHQSDPAAREVTVTYRLYYAGNAHERGEMKAGTYVLRGQPKNSSFMVPLTATIFVNGTGLNSFVMQNRELVISPLLKPGRNEIKLVSSRIDNIIDRGNDITITLFGPLEYNAAQGKYTGPQVLQIDSRAGWDKDPKSGLLVNKANPGSGQLEQVFPFVVAGSSAFPAR